MKLNAEQIKSITSGAQYVTEDGGMFNFFRFSAEEQHIYSKTEFYEKTFSTAGIEMRFKTDGDVLALKLKTEKATTRTYFSLDVFVDDKFIGSCKNFDENDKYTDYTTKQYPLGEFEHEFCLGQGDKRVRIVFPWSVITRIKEMEILNAGYVEPVKKSKKVIMYGDSITNGYDAMYSSASYASRIADAFDMELYNKAIGGEIFFPQLAKIKNDITPDYITVAYGTNDWNVSEREDFKIRCEGFYEALVNNYPDTLIFALTPIWRVNFSEERKFGPFGDVDKCIKNICAKFKNIKVISGTELVPHEAKYFADLRVHPNDEGFEYYYNNLKKQLSKHLM